MQKKIKYLIICFLLLTSCFITYNIVSAKGSSESYKVTNNIPSSDRYNALNSEDVLNNTEVVEYKENTIVNRKSVSTYKKDKETVTNTGNEVNELDTDNVIETKDFSNVIKAVELAEKTFLESDYNYAFDLVQGVTDNTLQTSLLERLEIVKNVIDLEKNITKFIYMFNNSKNIYDINEVRDYYKNKIYNQINEITNTSKKEKLENKIKDIVNIINDYDKPIISGVENNKYYKEVEIDVFDKSKVTIKVLYNGEEIEYKNSYSNVGVYEIFVRDEAFNEEYLTFTIENSAPKFLNILNGHRYNEIIVSVDDDNLDRINVFYYEDRTNTIISNNTKLEHDGTYRITAYDKSGNSTKIYVALDTEVSDVTVTKSNNDQATIDDVTVTISSSENIYVDGFSKVDEQTFQKTYSENGTYSVEVKDTCGNIKVVTFEVKNINKNNITLKVIEPNKYYIEQGSKYIDKGYYAYDLDGNDITDLVNISYLFQASGSNEWKYVDELDTNKLGVYKLTYTVSDNLGNKAKATRVVAIKEKSSLLNITNFFTKLF